MSQLRQHLPRVGLRPMLLGAAVLVAVGGATLLYRGGGVTPVSAPSSQAVTQSGARRADTARPAAPAQKPPDTGPTFDIVRVSPEGNAVLAGTAAPDQTVIIRDGSREIGHATADAAGQWVLVPDQKLTPGARELTLTARSPQGVEVAGQASVLLVVPDRAAKGAPETALAVLAPRPGSDAPGANAVPRVLQAPGAGGGNARLDLDVIDYDDQGAVSFAGHAPPGAHIRVYVDNRPAADALADAAARWSEKPGLVAPGQHRVRVDQLDARGRVVGRIELPFMREAGPPQAVAAGQVVVQPGATLWRLARQAYGQGTRYTVIYAYNSALIRDPNRIYPGQVFTLPDAATAAR